MLSSNGQVGAAGSGAAAISRFISWMSVASSEVRDFFRSRSRAGRVKGRQTMAATITVLLPEIQPQNPGERRLGCGRPDDQAAGRSRQTLLLLWFGGPSAVNPPCLMAPQPSMGILSSDSLSIAAFRRSPLAQQALPISAACVQEISALSPERWMAPMAHCRALVCTKIRPGRQNLRSVGAVSAGVSKQATGDPAPWQIH